MTFDYVKALLMAEKDVPFRTCTICLTPMVFTMRQYLPRIISCKCHTDVAQPLINITWAELRELLEKKK
jgi:hypothetical protein